MTCWTGPNCKLEFADEYEVMVSVFDSKHCERDFHLSQHYLQKLFSSRIDKIQDYVVKG